MHGTIEGNVAPDVEEMEYETGGHQGAARRRRRVEHGVIAALVVVVLAAIALVGFQSGADEEQDRATERTSNAAPATTEAPTTAPVAPTTAPGATDETPAPATPAAPAPGQPVHEHEDAPAVLENGRHPVRLTGLDVPGREVELDLVQWLTEEQATPYIEQHPDEYPGMYEQIEEFGTYPYDELVVNENPRLRTLPAADDVRVTVLRTPDSDHSPHTIGFEDLPNYFKEFPASASPQELSHNVFWLTVHGGEIVAIEEQFQS